LLQPDSLSVCDREKSRVHDQRHRRLQWGSRTPLVHGRDFRARDCLRSVLRVCAGGPRFLVRRATLMRIIVLALDGLLVVLVVPYRILQRRRELACLPMVVAVPEDLPSSHHLAKVFFTHVSTRDVREEYLRE
jgi:hypothetical protein